MTWFKPLKEVEIEILFVRLLLASYKDTFEQSVADMKPSDNSKFRRQKHKESKEHTVDIFFSR